MQIGLRGGEPIPQPQILFYARALYTYQPEEDGEIAFNESGNYTTTLKGACRVRYVHRCENNNIIINMREW